MAAALAATSISASAGPAGLLGGVLVIEAGLPLPVPSDLLILVLGERAAAGVLPLWLAVAALELIAAVGTAALFLAVRGPARALLNRLASRARRTEERLARITARLESGGGAALVVGRTTPGLRTLTVVAAAISRLSPARALPLLFVGSSIFLQGHLLLGFGLGPVADSLIAGSAPVVIALLVVLVMGAAVLWFLRRGRREGVLGFAEASCPACLVVAATIRSSSR